MCHCNSHQQPRPANTLAALLAACDISDGPADSSCCVDDGPDCRQQLAAAAAESVRRCRPPVIFTPTPTPTPGPWTPTPTPGPSTPGAAGCKPGEVYVQADNSLGLPAGCYPNELGRRQCKPVIPPWKGHHGGVDACFDGSGRVTAFVEKSEVVDPF